MTAEAMIGLQRLLMCAVAVSMPPPSSGSQTAHSPPTNRPLTAFVSRPGRCYKAHVLEFRILGPVEVWDGEKAVALGGQRQRAVLALLAIHVGEVVPSERLITYLWGESPPPTAATSLQNAVSQLRKALGADVVETRAPGYALNAKKDAVDARRFEQLVNEARSAEADRRAGLVDEALQMCVVRLSATSRMSPLPRTRRPGSRSFG